MFYELTQHAVERLQQRGKPTDGVKMALRYGRGGGDGLHVLHSRDARWQIARRRIWVERLKQRRPANRVAIRCLNHRIAALKIMSNCAVVVKHGRVVTLYNRTRRRHSH